MSIKPLSEQRSLFEAGVYLGDMLDREKGSERFRFFFQNVWPALLGLGPALNQMYCADNGRPAENPVRLLGVTILQYMEKLPDRRAVDAMTFDLRWKCALGMENVCSNMACRDWALRLRSMRCVRRAIWEKRPRSAWTPRTFLGWWRR